MPNEVRDDDLDRDQLQKDILALYAREHEELGESGTLEHLERGEGWDLSGTLAEGGVLVFPHVGVQDCGYQVAACVHACLNSGADRVVVVSVLHAFTHEMEMARRRVAAGGDPADEIFWGIQGPGLEGRREWMGDHALMSWRHFWQAEVSRRGLRDSQVPEVVERYPYLAGGLTGHRRTGQTGGRRSGGLHGGLLSSRPRVRDTARRSLCPR